MTVRTSNYECRRFVEARTEFRGSNLFGGWEKSAGDQTIYVVYSYGRHWPLYVYAEGRWYENSSRYSNSSSRHRSHARPMASTILLSRDQMEDLVTYSSFSKVVERRLTGQVASVLEDEAHALEEAVT